MQLTKEKKNLVETSAKAGEDLSGIEEKFDHLMKVKSKLMATIDEIETAYEKEKRLGLKFPAVEHFRRQTKQKTCCQHLQPGS